MNCCAKCYRQLKHGFECMNKNCPGRLSPAKDQTDKCGLCHSCHEGRPCHNREQSGAESVSGRDYNKMMSDLHDELEQLKSVSGEEFKKVEIEESFTRDGERTSCKINGVEMLLDQPRPEWEREFYELTATMDGQHRPKLLLLIRAERQKEYERGREELRETIAKLKDSVPPYPMEGPNAEMITWAARTAYMDALSNVLKRYE